MIESELQGPRVDGAELNRSDTIYLDELFTMEYMTVTVIIQS